MLSNFKLLTKTDRRKQWKLLKSKHSKAISAAKLDFDLKLGPALDKYQTQVDKLTKLAATTELHTNQIQPVLLTVKPLKQIVASYRDKVKTLSEPAKKELTALLKAIDADGVAWTELAQALHSQRPTGPTAAQKAAANGVVITLDNLRSIAATIVTRGERARVSYAKAKPNPRPEAAALVSKLVEAARLAGPAAYELANAATQVAAGSNYALFKTQAKAAARLIQGLRKAAEAFHTAWNMDLDVHTVTNDTDALALKGNYDQIISDCDYVLKLIGKLP
jgi:hypothetical protein